MATKQPNLYLIYKKSISPWSKVTWTFARKSMEDWLLYWLVPCGKQIPWNICFAHKFQLGAKGQQHPDKVVNTSRQIINLHCRNDNILHHQAQSVLEGWRICQPQRRRVFRTLCHLSVLQRRPTTSCQIQTASDRSCSKTEPQASELFLTLKRWCGCLYFLNIGTRIFGPGFSDFLLQLFIATLWATT